MCTCSFFREDEGNERQSLMRLLEEQNVDNAISRAMGKKSQVSKTRLSPYTKFPGTPS
jgi:hypothetical protein